MLLPAFQGQLGAQEGQIGVEIVPEHLGLSFAAFSECEPHALGTPDDVAVGNDEAISCNDYARADAAVPSITLDADNGWTDPVGHGGDGARIGIERRFILRVADRVFVENTVRDIGHRKTLKD